MLWSCLRSQQLVALYMHVDAEIKAEWRVWCIVQYTRRGRGVITIKGFSPWLRHPDRQSLWLDDTPRARRRRRTSPAVCCCEWDLACGRTACVSSSPWVGSLPACRRHTHMATSALPVARPLSVMMFSLRHRLIYCSSLLISCCWGLLCL